MFTVALTGGIGSGKSTVAAKFAELGVDVFDTDIIAREVVEPGQPALREIAVAFGNQVIRTDGTLDRKALREIVFNDPEKRVALENILHPKIRECTETLVRQSTSPYCIVCIPLLFETNQQERYQRVLVVDVPQDLQISRTIRRDGSPRATIEGILAAQVDRKTRIQMAHDVIDNSGDPNALQTQVARLHDLYLTLAGSAT